MNEQLAEFFTGWKSITKAWQPFDSLENEDALLSFVKERGGPLSGSAFDVAFRLLRQQNRLTPVASAPAIPASADQIKAQADRVPLDNRLYESLQGMSKIEVAQQFYSDPVFAEIYRRAAAKWFFEIPLPTRNPQPAPRSRSAAPATAPTEPVPQTARDYYAIPAQSVIRRYRLEPAFKQAVDSLISRGLI